MQKFDKKRYTVQLTPHFFAERDSINKNFVVYIRRGEASRGNGVIVAAIYKNNIVKTSFSYFQLLSSDLQDELIQLGFVVSDDK